MLLGLQLGGLAFVIGLACLLLGRLVACALGPRWLARMNADNVCAAAFLGTALCFLGFGWFSYLGLPARSAAFGVFALAGGLVGVLAWQGRLLTVVSLHRPGVSARLLI